LGHHIKGEEMATTPKPISARQADEHFREVSFEIQTLAQSYINGGVDNEDMRNAIRGILALTVGLQQVLNFALQPRQ
jgi:hypothetical protein